ncbi:MAG: Tim44 domain-containing protein [Burkholderiales bacterium]|nr:Tim44 domain-containing protein [Burkholderiales bacterium]
MKVFSLLAVVLTLGLALPMSDAEAAKRFGGGKSTGMQRQMNTPDKAPTAAPAQAAAAVPAAGAAAASTRSKWMGPIAGLAAGLGLAALASHFGFGEELANMMMIGLLIMAVVLVIGFIMRKRMGAQTPAMAGAGAGPMRYSASGAPQGVPASRPLDLNMPGSSAGPLVAATTARNIPADFDVQGFARSAKVNFIRLQAANDAGNLDDIREFTTPEMFAEIKMSIDERGGAGQFTDVVSINADVLEVAEEASRYVVSVRLTGTIREDGANAEAVDEIWHLTKPRDGASGWLLAGIQQAG